MPSRGWRHAGAQFNLGVSYGKGRGVPQDDKEAVKWYRKAAEQGLAAAEGDQQAMENRDAFSMQMTPSQIEEAQRLSREWYQRHNTE